MARRRPLRTALFALGGLALALGAGAVGASIYGSGEIESRMQRVAQAAGLTLQHDGVSVSPLGQASIQKLALLRPDGSAVVRVASITGALSPIDALRGRRRPDRVDATGLQLDVRVVDGRPDELLRLARAAREALGRRKAAGPKPAASGPRRGTAIRLDGGRVQVRASGRGAELLAKGLVLDNLRVDVDTAAGRGEVSAALSGAAKASLSARLLPPGEGRPARVEARFSPAMRLPLPERFGLDALALEVAGFGYDAEAGPSVEGVSIRQGEQALVSVAQVGLDDGAVVLGEVALSAPRALLERALGGRKGSWPPRGAGWKARIKRISVARDKQSRIVIEDARSPLPGGLGELRLARGVAQVDAEGRSLAALQSLSLERPELALVWRESDVRRLPGGDGLWRTVERLRGRLALPAEAPGERGAAAGQPDEGDEGDGGKRGEAAKGRKRGKAVKGRKRGKRGKRKRRRGRREPATKAAIAPLKALHKRLLGLDERLADALLRLGRLPSEVKISGGRLALRAPAADEALAGIDKLSLALSRRMADASRSVELKATPFIGEEPWGEVVVTIQAAPGGRLAKASLSLGGRAWARALSTLGDGASVRKDADLSLALTWTAETADRPVFSGKLTFAHVGVNWWRIAPRPIDDFSMSAGLSLSVDPDSVRLHLAPMSLGKARLDLVLEALHLGPRKAPAAKEGDKRRKGGKRRARRRAPGPTVHLRLEAPKQDCGAVASAIPASLIPTIGTIEAKGEVAGHFDLTIPLERPYKGKLKADLDDEGCEVTRFGEVDVTELGRPFKRPVNESGTLLEDQLIGPRSDAWVPIAELPPWVPYVMIATEDAAFYHHRGVRLGLTSRAIKMCLDYGRFVYGGSTITQQLVKNLYLTRDKNLARKFEELLIVWQIERSLYDQERLDQAEDDERPIKDRILELYINGIEFAPHLYGIQRGAKLYFDKDARKLTPLEAAFLAANKPCPKCGHKRFEQKKWTPWWQERMVNIMNKMRSEGIITEAQFAAEAPYVPRFVGWPQPEQPAQAVGGEEE